VNPAINDVTVWLEGLVLSRGEVSLFKSDVLGAIEIGYGLMRHIRQVNAYKPVLLIAVQTGMLESLTPPFSFGLKRAEPHLGWNK
jgi:hypothetical protein